MNTLHYENRIVEIDRARRQASINGVPLALGSKEYQILQTLAQIARGQRRKRSTAIADLLKAFHVSSR